MLALFFTPNNEPPQRATAAILDSSCGFSMSGMTNEYHIPHSRRKAR